MSYDVDIGGESFNYTYNVSQLFYDHIPAERDRGGLSELDGLTGKQAVVVLAKAFDDIHRSILKYWQTETIGEPLFCALYDSKNGWGSAVGAIVFLAQIMAACSTHPRSKVRIY